MEIPLTRTTADQVACKWKLARLSAFIDFPLIIAHIAGISFKFLGRFV
jgi:hypothetical protein